MPNLEWEVRHDLVTPDGTIIFNQPDSSGRIWVIESDGYKIVPPMRVTNSFLSQVDGSYLHPRYKGGLVATMKVRYCLGTTYPGEVAPACDAILREMHEDLTAALDSIRTPAATTSTSGVSNDQRLLWLPTGAGERMLDQIQTLQWTDPEFDAPFTYVTFAVESPYPYAIDFTQQSTEIDSTTASIDNNGTSNFWPVAQVFAGGSDLTAFTLTNNSILDQFGNPLELHYDSTLEGAEAIPAGHYAEISFFKGTIFLDGNSDDLTAGLDPTVTDFWPLQVGANSITTDADAVFLWNPAWS